MFDLTGRNIIVAGGAGYLGRPIVDGLLEQGATVTVCDMSEPGLEECAAARSEETATGRLRTLRFDAALESDIERVIQRVVGNHGRLDGLVNMTLGTTATSLEELSADEFNRTNQVNLTSTFLFARRAAREMTGGGSITLFSSMYGLLAPNPGDYPGDMNPNPIEYGVGKAAIVQMARYMAAHYGSRQIRVNAIAPGAFPRTSVQENHPEFIRGLAAKAMLKRIGRRDEVAGAVVFLAADEAAFITGQVLSIDGGVTSW